MGFFKGIGKMFKSGFKGLYGSKPDQAATHDIRSPAERALQESQVEFFRNRMSSPDMGYQQQYDAETPYWNRAKDTARQGIRGMAADSGFGMLQHGPSVSTYGKVEQGMEEDRAMQVADRRRANMEWTMSAGRGAATPQGRETVVKQGRPSLFSQLAGGFAGGAGKAMGGSMFG